MSPGALEPDHFSRDFRDFLVLLARNEVRYLIVGGEAVIYYGHARLTGDIDIFYEISPGNLERMFSALDEFWEGNIPGVSSVDDFAPELIIQFGVPPNRIDLINSISGVRFEEAWPERLTLVMPCAEGDVELHYIGLDALIRNKEASGRPKDLEDLTFLQKTT